MKSDLVIKFGEVELTKNMDLVEAPDFKLLPSVDNSLEDYPGMEGVQIISTTIGAHSFPFVFIMDSNNLTLDRDKLIRALNNGTQKLMISLFPDRYWNAILDGESSFIRPMEQTNEIAVSLTFLIPEGKAFATVSKEFTATLNAEGILEAEVVNEGTSAVPINYRVKNNHENGYFGAVSEFGAGQVGNAQESDTEIIQRSEWVIKDDLSSQLLNNWENNKGFLTENFPKVGSWKGQTIDGRQYMIASNYGTGSAWHGPTKYRKFSADSNGKVGSSSFTATTRLWFANGKVAQAGIMEFIIANSDGSKRIGFIVHKYSKSNNLFRVKLYYSGTPNAKEDKSYEFDMGKNTITSWTSGIFKIEKIKERIKFIFGGKTYSFVNMAIKNVEFDNVTLYSSHHGITPPVTRMDWDYVFLQVHNVDVDTGNDIPNSYAEGSELIVDNVNSKYYYNPNQEAFDTAIPIGDVKGSAWFKAQPGSTKVQFYYSEFSDPPPTITAEIREAFY